MDARTTIAKDMLIAMQTVFMQRGKTLTALERKEALVAVVQTADDLLSELRITAPSTPQPAPAPARGVPVWRRMTETPADNEVVLLHAGLIGSIIPVYFAKVKGQWQYYLDNTRCPASEMDCWLDLNGFTPEVGE